MTTETTDTYENDAREILQQETTSFIYMQVAKLFEELSVELTTGEIAELVINAVSVNLGTLIGQCNDEYQEDVMKAVKKLIDHSYLMTIKKNSYVSYGMIGHA